MGENWGFRSDQPEADLNEYFGRNTENINHSGWGIENSRTVATALWPVEEIWFCIELWSCNRWICIQKWPEKCSFAANSEVEVSILFRETWLSYRRQQTSAGPWLRRKSSGLRSDCTRNFGTATANVTETRRCRKIKSKDGLDITAFPVSLGQFWSCCLSGCEGSHLDGMVIPCKYFLGPHFIDDCLSPHEDPYKWMETISGFISEPPSWKLQLSTHKNARPTCFPAILQRMLSFIEKERGEFQTQS